jgi:hypothetical protein
MNIKKILALVIVVLALFSCLNVASAGLFDVFDNIGGENGGNETFTINGFTVDLPKGSTISDSKSTEDGVTTESYDVTLKNSNEIVTIEVFYGPNCVDSVDEYVENWVSDGSGESFGYYNGWAVIKEGTGSAATYELVIQDGSRFISIWGDDLPLIKSIADTYKKT